MAELTSFSITLGRTKNLGDYNNAKVEVSLTGAFTHGEDPDAAVDAAIEQARRHITSALNGRNKPATPAAPPAGETLEVVVKAEEPTPPLPVGATPDAVVKAEEPPLPEDLGEMRKATTELAARIITERQASAQDVVDVVRSVAGVPKIGQVPDAKINELFAALSLMVR